ncbi:hypothetical protein A2982_00825 [candidate division WWE3 bacterium RIFCSPLOWO2_01_FULL_39_13]|uniref:DUF4352 domain-containing protein n=1 Tax=candidate division WWE3 bacterium RIFCSPLOWO2_01_FULL_39_13 TaxID=1802624 RepID=A0A1F4V5A7_UNCKA|nr:MAG: hypothetical protein A2982_00825 [candidate division WWE3 bacterium RIFCSPLOWO2_01_FULL_39_13]
MNSKIFFIILLVVAGVVVFGLTAKSKQGLPATKPSPSLDNARGTTTLSSQTKTMGVVEVKITPVSVVSGKDVVFELSLNTHSAELNYDYTQIATLTDDHGNSYKPTQWTGGNSGHHLEGELLFPPFPENPKQLTLTLDGVDNKSEAFTWQR